MTYLGLGDDEDYADLRDGRRARAPAHQLCRPSAGPRRPSSGRPARPSAVRGPARSASHRRRCAQLREEPTDVVLRSTGTVRASTPTLADRRCPVASARSTSRNPPGRGGGVGAGVVDSAAPVVRPASHPGQRPSPTSSSARVVQRRPGGGLTAFKGNVPVIMNLQEVDKGAGPAPHRLRVGLCYGLGGSMEKVANSVYLLTPSDVEGVRRGTSVACKSGATGDRPTPPTIG